MAMFELAQQTLGHLAPFAVLEKQPKIGEPTTDRSRQLIQQTWGLLEGGVQGNPRAQSALEVFRDEPDDERNRERLATYLAEYLKQHHEVVEKLRSLVEQLQEQAHQNKADQTTQNINNLAPNQGAQGTFSGPVTFNQGSGTTFNQQGQNVGGDLIQAGRDVTQVGGDYVRGDKVGGDKISGDISVSGVRGTGIAIGHKAQAQVQQRGDADAFARAFEQVYQAINARPEDEDVGKGEITTLVRDIEAEAQQGDAANEKKLSRWHWRGLRMSRKWRTPTPCRLPCRLPIPCLLLKKAHNPLQQQRRHTTAQAVGLNCCWGSMGQRAGGATVGRASRDRASFFGVHHRSLNQPAPA